MKSRRFTFCLGLLSLIGFARNVSGESPREAEMAGYLLVPHEKVPESYDAGFSMYVSAWPLLRAYPGNRFQTGLFGTWMFAKLDQPQPKKMYSDIEGGLGWWRDTRFATETPKFIMGGVALNFVEWANGPGAGKGRDWADPKGKYGVAQLSSRILWPPDGLNLKQGTCGEWFGYGYLNLPLLNGKPQTAQADVPTGPNCWTLFLNTENFKGPVAFFPPYFWSRPTVNDPTLSGMFLDSRPSNPNKAVQMETQYVPAYQAEDAHGRTYARVAPTSFPQNANGVSPVVHRITAYNRSALYDSVADWLQGGEVANGSFNPDGAIVHAFKDQGGSTWRIYGPETERDKRIAIDWKGFASPTALDSETYGYRWNQELISSSATTEGSLATLPEYFRLDTKDDGRQQWVAVAPASVPKETGLAGIKFNRSLTKPSDPYVTPEEVSSCWKSPGPVAGPFDVKLGDGSRVTYYWYRFADQPALLNADLTDAERETLQARIEKLHRAWTIDRDYLPPPSHGELAYLDPALVVTPPPGLEIGYVPIATRQGAD